MRNVGTETYAKLYESGVIPILDYGNGVWGYSKKNHAELIQNKAIRYYLGVHSFTPIPALHGEMGWLSCKYRTQLNMLRFWNRLVKMPSHRLTKHIFLTEFNSRQRYKNWSGEMRNIFQTMNLMNVYVGGTTCNLEICKSLLIKLNEDEWRSILPTKPKLRQYISFKNMYKLEPYVKNVRNKYERSLIAKLRCGILQLNVELGRFGQIQLQDRLCTICNLHLIEDEIHFICSCPVYDTERAHFYNQMSNIDPNFREKSTEDKFISIMENSGQQLAKFIYKIWNKRNSIVYN